MSSDPVPFPSAGDRMIPMDITLPVTGWAGPGLVVNVSPQLVSGSDSEALGAEVQVPVHGRNCIQPGTSLGQAKALHSDYVAICLVLLDDLEELAVFV